MEPPAGEAKSTDGESHRKPPKTQQPNPHKPALRIHLQSVGYLERPEKRRCEQHHIRRHRRPKRAAADATVPDAVKGAAVLPTSAEFHICPPGKNTVRSIAERLAHPYRVKRPATLVIAGVLRRARPCAIAIDTPSSYGEPQTLVKAKNLWGKP